MENTLSFYKSPGFARRHWVNIFMSGLLFLAGALAVVPLLSVFTYLMIKGVPALNWDFFTQLPKPVGEIGGGMANALVGTSVLVLLASAIGVPWGLFVGIYLSEYGHKSRLSGMIRFSTDMLSSVPSIVIGLLVYALLVIPMKRFSAHAGGVALAILMVPTIARTTEEILKMVPVHIREAGLALGIPRWKVILQIVLKGSLGAVATGVMLALARVAGETAPLLFTAFGNQYWSKSLDQPIASLPVQIYSFAISPYEDWHRQAWAGAFILVMWVCVLNLITRFILRKATQSKKA